MSTQGHNPELIYQLNDKPPLPQTFFSAIQHLLASFIGVVTPTLVIGGVLGLGEHIPYLISIALIASGIGTYVQAKRFGPLGSGLLSIQGTSFAFLSSLIAAGFVVKSRGGGSEEIIALMTGLCFFGAFIEIILSRFFHKLRKIITPTVTGVVIALIGLSLIKVAFTDIAGGFNAPDFGALSNLGVAGIVLATIVFLNRSATPAIRLSAIIAGLAVGAIITLYTGKMSLNGIESDLFTLPVPFKYGISFDWQLFIPVALIYVITTIESTGDLTATAMLSGEPIEGEHYVRRIRGGILADGVNSLVASCLNSFPTTTFSQNNGVIQMTGVASRHIGYMIAGLFILMGLFPIIGAVLMLIPKPVLGGATLVMFGTVAASGIRIIASEKLDRRRVMIIAVSLGMGLGVTIVPDILSQMPELVKTIFGSSVTTGGLTAILLTLLLPQTPETLDAGRSVVKSLKVEPSVIKEESQA
ncbi:uracil-xanthine permease family protein [Endozoicomonas ascidiicola]|uniref:uracil-xanthine permease family protein n=1 Tax=Endozoicomonas ascidiicola TaxID=1698521 RepID=UPI000836C1F6|nr:nucleobase:cation symporter-2 family protein [Endozoicomonas ascidiicola]